MSSTAADRVGPDGDVPTLLQSADLHSERFGVHIRYTLRDGVVTSELRQPFDLIADGAAAEEQLPRRNRFKNAGNEIWLPRLNEIRNSARVWL